MSTDNSAVAVFQTHPKAEEAVRELQKSGFDMTKLSIIGALEAAAVVGGVSALGAALMSIGVPDNSVLHYETELKNDRLLLVVHGTADEIDSAKSVLSEHGVDVIVHDAPEAVGV